MKKILLMIALAASFGLGYAFNNLSHSDQMPSARVTGIGGIFFKCKDPKALKAWYAKNLGMKIDSYGTLFEFRLAEDSSKKGQLQWTPFNEKTKYFEPSTKEFMINYRVDDLVRLSFQLKKEKVTIVDTLQSYDYGKFLHIMDPEGNKIELWEPK